MLIFRISHYVAIESKREKEKVRLGGVIACGADCSFLCAIIIFFDEVGKTCNFILYFRFRCLEKRWLYEYKIASLNWAVKNWRLEVSNFSFFFFSLLSLNIGKRPILVSTIRFSSVWPFSSLWALFILCNAPSHLWSSSGTYGFAGLTVSNTPRKHLLSLSFCSLLPSRFSTFYRILSTI